MKEAQNIEWKETWRDEYLRWISGFADAEGGALHIGRNDRGVVVGLPNAAKLLEDIPNKVRDPLGILVKVNLRKERGKEWLEIVVEPYPYPVSYKGEYHLRYGSTKQELKGAALDRFLLRKQGRTWDGAPVPGVSPRDLSRMALAAFRKLAKDSRRLDATVLREPAVGLLDKLTGPGSGTGGPAEGEPGTTLKTTQKTTLKTTQRIRAILRAQPDASRRDVAGQLGDITEDGVKYHLDKLRKAGNIRHIGPAKGGRWEVVG